MARISSFGQNGLYMEYKGTNGETTDILKIYSLDGNSLNERTNLKYPANPTNNLRLKNSPDTTYSLLANRTYLKIPDEQLSEYKIEIIGTENINGYTCTKISLNTRGQNNQTIWITDQIPLYQDYLTAEINDIDLSKLTKALKNKNLKGLPVRITYSSENSMQYDFVKLKKINMDKSWFLLDGYTEATMFTKNKTETKIDTKLTKYTNKEYGFSVLLPSIDEAPIENIDAGFANISRIRIIAYTQQMSGSNLIKYNVTYRVIAEIFTPKNNIDSVSFYKKIKDEIIQMQENSCSGNIKIVSKSIETKNNSTEVIFKIEHSDYPLVETRKVIIKKNKSFCISYLTRPEYFNETEKNDFISSFLIE